MKQLCAPLFVLLLSLAFLIIPGCTPSKRGLFGKKTPHEKYIENIEDAGLAHTTMGSLWMSAAARSLNQPLKITLPFKESGYFAADRPYALGYTFSVKRGERIQIEIATVPSAGVILFSELWRVMPDNSRELLQAADSTQRVMTQDADEDGNYLLRMQPELLEPLEYSLVIKTLPSLAFPVRKSDNPRVISLWGVDRDGGSRSHEGVDIAAAKRTPAVASAAGVITRVDENELGGKVVFMRPEGKGYSLYYAHLDSQLAVRGQHVREGDVLGLIGNTGNARGSVPHLHFGIYTRGGAVDPFPFINPNRPQPRAVTVPLDMLNKYARISTAAIQTTTEGSTNPIPVSKDLPVLPLSATGNMYKVLLPDGREGFVSGSVVTSTPIRKTELAQDTRLLDRPVQTAPAKKLLPKGTSVNVLAKVQEFYLLQSGEWEGWANLPGL